jgi:nitronate monooxygenase
MPSLKIGNLEVPLPIIQGGMGVRVSRAGLAAAVANEGGIGVIATAGIGRFEDFPRSKFSEINELALRQEIRTARGNMKAGALGVNIMVALADFDSLVRTAVEENIDVIISGAGLPLSLPQYVEGKDIKLIPVVSSARTLAIICKRWKHHYNRLPDAVVVEGPLAGGHLGYSYEDLRDDSPVNLDDILTEVIELANTFTPKIPVIAAGGIFDGADIAHHLARGAAGVQMATRFVCTTECDVHENFKQAYINAKLEDIAIINSPVGLPGKVIKNAFVDKIKAGLTVPFQCNYKCLKSCDPRTAPYCIARVLANAAEGRLDESFAFAGTNAYKCTEIIPVRELVAKLKAEYATAMSSPAKTT